MNEAEINGDGWEVELFDTGLFRWKNKEDVYNLIKILEDGLFID